MKPISTARQETIDTARALGADEATIEKLTTAVRVRRAADILLPMEHLETLSRGKGWCRSGRGDSATWGIREEGHYRVGPGEWVVFGSDGYNRRKQTEWVVENVQVGEQTWTIAN